MKIAVRTDASSAIGSGHLMRCLALAEELQNRGAQIVFITANTEQKWLDLIENKNFASENIDVLLPSEAPADGGAETSKQVLSVQKYAINLKLDVTQTLRVLNKSDFDRIIIDHYGIESRWESAMRDNVKRIMVIDDLANRGHDCDMLLDSVFGRENGDYQELVPPNCKLLLGTKYALLRPEYSRLREIALERRQSLQKVRKILISLGGVDQANVTRKILDQLNRFKWNSEFEIDVVVGSGFVHKDSLKDQISSMSIKTFLFSAVDNMAVRIANADVGIGAFGVSTWERFCLGLPSVNLITQDNQVEVVRKLQGEQFSGLLSVGSISTGLEPLLKQIVFDRNIYLKFVAGCSQAVDGNGLSRVAQAFLD